MSRGAPKGPITYEGEYDPTRTYLPRQIVTITDGTRTGYLATATSTAAHPAGNPAVWLPLGDGTVGSIDFRAVYLYLAHSGGAPDTTLGSSVMPKNAADGVHDVSCTTAVVSGDQTVVLLTHPGSTGDYANLVFEVTKIADASGAPITHVKETQNTGFFLRTAGVISGDGPNYSGSLFTTNGFDPGVTITTAGWYVVYASLSWV